MSWDFASAPGCGTTAAIVDRVDPYTDTIVDNNANWVRSEAGNAAVTIAPSESLQITPSFRYQSTDSARYLGILFKPVRPSAAVS